MDEKLKYCEVALEDCRFKLPSSPKKIVNSNIGSRRQSIRLQDKVITSMKECTPRKAKKKIIQRHVDGKAQKSVEPDVVVPAKPDVVVAANDSQNNSNPVQLSDKDIVSNLRFSILVVQSGSMISKCWLRIFSNFSWKCWAISQHLSKMEPGIRTLTFLLTTKCREVKPINTRNHNLTNRWSQQHRLLLVWPVIMTTVHRCRSRFLIKPLRLKRCLNLNAPHTPKLNRLFIIQPPVKLMPSNDALCQPKRTLISIHSQHRLAWRITKQFRFRLRSRTMLRCLASEYTIFFF